MVASHVGSPLNQFVNTRIFADSPGLPVPYLTVGTNIHVAEHRRVDGLVIDVVLGSDFETTEIEDLIRDVACSDFETGETVVLLLIRDNRHIVVVFQREEFLFHPAV
jgi:hypothetical protein